MPFYLVSFPLFSRHVRGDVHGYLVSEILGEMGDRGRREVLVELAWGKTRVIKIKRIHRLLLYMHVDKYIHVGNAELVISLLTTCFILCASSGWLNLKTVASPNCSRSPENTEYP